jgi:hypothetical protein
MTGGIYIMHADGDITVGYTTNMTTMMTRCMKLCSGKIKLYKYIGANKSALTKINQRMTPKDDIDAVIELCDEITGLTAEVESTSPTGPSKSGVYIIDPVHGDTIKIGWTTNFGSLYGRYRTPYGSQIVIYKFSTTYPDDEVRVHRLCEAHKVTNELFKRSCLKAALRNCSAVTGSDPIMEGQYAQKKRRCTIC